MLKLIKKLANSIGIDFSQEQNEQLKGVSRVQSLEKILAWGNKTISAAHFTRLMTSKNDDYLLHVHEMSESEILPDVIKILNFLVDESQPVALGSASKNARLILNKVNLIDKFEAIVDGTNVSKAKPDPEVFLIAAKQLGMPTEDCIVFEDSVAGVQAANSAYMISVGIDEGATILCGGLGRPDGVSKGWFVKPTIFTDVSNNMRIAREEIFGPALVIIPFENEARRQKQN